MILNLKKRERIRQFTQGHLSDPENIDAVDQAVVQAICERQFIYSVSHDDQDFTDGVALVETLAISPTAVPDSYGQEDHLGGLPVIPHLTEAELVSRQRADQSIKHVISQIEQGDKPPPTLRHELPELPLLLRELTRMNSSITSCTGDAKWALEPFISLYSQLNFVTQF